MPGEMGLGLLPEDFPDAGLHIWELDGEHDTLPPRDVGGNIDVKHMTKGSTVYFPVKNDGALFSTADCHAAHGDGEVCVTGIEAPMFVTAQFDVRTDMDIQQPQLETTGT